MFDASEFKFIASLNQNKDSGPETAVSIPKNLNPN